MVRKLRDVGPLGDSPMFKYACLSFLFVLTNLSASQLHAAEPQIKIAQAGQNITLWDGWNVDAKIFIKVDGGEGDDCIRLWWITMGINSESWEVCNQTEVVARLPLIYGELRAGSFSRETAVAVSDQAGVAYSFELCDRIIDC